MVVGGRGAVVTGGRLTTVSDDPAGRGEAFGSPRASASGLEDEMQPTNARETTTEQTAELMRGTGFIRARLYIAAPCAIGTFEPSNDCHANEVADLEFLLETPRSVERRAGLDE